MEARGAPAGRVSTGSQLEDWWRLTVEVPRVLPEENRGKKLANQKEIRQQEQRRYGRVEWDEAREYGLLRRLKSNGDCFITEKADDDVCLRLDCIPV